MGIDRFVYWKGTGPTLENLHQTLEDYLGEAVRKIELYDDVRLVVLLHGKPSFPFKRIPEMDDKYRAVREVHDERWFEVYWTKADIDIITRMADEYTNVVAEGFAQLCARFWKGRYEG